MKLRHKIHVSQASTFLSLPAYGWTAYTHTLRIVNVSAGYLQSYEKSVPFFSLKYEVCVRAHKPNRPRCVTYISAFVYFLRQFCLVWTEIWCVLVGNGLDYLVVCLLCCFSPASRLLWWICLFLRPTWSVIAQAILSG